MKKIIYLFLLLLFPFNVLAYSDNVVLGGQTLGIEVNTKGILVIGFYKVNGDYINKHLEIGDKITHVNDEELNSVEDLVNKIDSNMKDNSVDVTIKRGEKELKEKIELSYFNGSYRTGLYVKGSITGIGTLTYIDPETGVYGILGHVINESKTNERIEVKTGKTYFAKVTSFTRSINGNPGSKNADIIKETEFGNIIKNTNYGVFGKTTQTNNSKTIKVGDINDVSLGEAYIYTSNEKDEIKKYTINILEIDKEAKEKNYYFEITDEELLKLSGGIVQGMSGSPIVQNDKIIGAVTRVLIDDVEKGYGINIVTMLEEGDNLINID